MSDRVQFKVSAIPVETLSTENSTDKDVLASEINHILGGGGDSLSLTAYNQSAANQGYLDGTVNYADASHSAGGTLLTGLATGDFLFVKNTGHKFSSATVLGAATEDCVIVAVRTDAYANGSQSGWFTAADVAEEHFFEIAFLQPGQAVLFPLGASNKSVTQFGSNANDFTNLGSTSQNGVGRIYVKTVLSNGSAASDGNAIEFLACS